MNKVLGKAIIPSAALVLALGLARPAAIAQEATAKRPTAEESAPPDPVIEAAIDKRQDEINDAITRFAQPGVDVKAALKELLARFPEEQHLGVLRRIRQRADETARQRAAAERERRWHSDVKIDGESFNLTAAVLLMNTGGYDAITTAFRDHPELVTETKSIGRFLLSAGVKPDMVMVHRLKEIWDNYLENERQKEREKESAGKAN
jgi:hypothetical protein